MTTKKIIVALVATAAVFSGNAHVGGLALRKARVDPIATSSGSATAEQDLEALEAGDGAALSAGPTQHTTSNVAARPSWLQQARQLLSRKRADTQEDELEHVDDADEIIIHSLDGAPRQTFDGKNTIQQLLNAQVFLTGQDVCNGSAGRGQLHIYGIDAKALGKTEEDVPTALHQLFLEDDPRLSQSAADQLRALYAVEDRPEQVVLFKVPQSVSNLEAARAQWGAGKIAELAARIQPAERAVRGSKKPAKTLISTKKWLAVLASVSAGMTLVLGSQEPCGKGTEHTEVKVGDDGGKKNFCTVPYDALDEEPTLSECYANSRGWNMNSPFVKEGDTGCHLQHKFFECEFPDATSHALWTKHGFWQGEGILRGYENDIWRSEFPKAECAKHGGRWKGQDIHVHELDDYFSTPPTNSPLKSFSTKEHQPHTKFAYAFDEAPPSYLPGGTSPQSLGPYGDLPKKGFYKDGFARFPGTKRGGLLGGRRERDGKHMSLTHGMLFIPPPEKAFLRTGVFPFGLVIGNLFFTALLYLLGNTRAQRTCLCAPFNIDFDNEEIRPRILGSLFEWTEAQLAKRLLSKDAAAAAMAVFSPLLLGTLVQAYYLKQEYFGRPDELYNATQGAKAAEVLAFLGLVRFGFVTALSRYQCSMQKTAEEALEDAVEEAKKRMQNVLAGTDTLRVGSVEEDETRMMGSEDVNRAAPAAGALAPGLAGMVAGAAGGAAAAPAGAAAAGVGAAAGAGAAPAAGGAAESESGSTDSEEDSTDSVDETGSSDSAPPAPLAGVQHNGVLHL